MKTVDELGVLDTVYQTRAYECVGRFLEQFGENSKKVHASLHGRKGNSSGVIPCTLRVNKNPPSVQVVQHPEGGTAAHGSQALREKIAIPHLPFENDIVVAYEQELTRECIILTLHDASFEIVLNNNLIAPRELREFFMALKGEYPDHFVVLQRYLMGIEKDDAVTVPFSFVAADDAPTWNYLTSLPFSLE